MNRKRLSRDLSGVQLPKPLSSLEYPHDVKVDVTLPLHVGIGSQPGVAERMPGCDLSRSPNPERVPVHSKENASTPVGVRDRAGTYSRCGAPSVRPSLTPGCAA
jgi:hypothetical protein